MQCSSHKWKYEPVLVLACHLFTACPIKTDRTSPTPSSFIYMWHRRQQDDILPIWEAKSLLSGPGQSDSPVGTPYLVCAVMLTVPATCPFDCTALHKRLPVHLPSQGHSCAIYLITAWPHTVCSCTYPIFNIFWGNYGLLPLCCSEYSLQIKSMEQVLTCSHSVN
jgi:hypothetical protein